MNDYRVVSLFLILAANLGVTQTANAETVHVQKASTSFAIDGRHGSTGNNKQVFLFNASQSNVNQQWTERNRGGGFYSYQKVNTSLCIDGGNGGLNGQAVILFECNNTNRNQHWRKVSTGGNRYRLEKRNAPGFSIDGNQGGKNLQGIYLWDSDSANVNQQWVFSTVGGANASTRFKDIENHILNQDSMTIAELQTWATTFSREAGQLYKKPSDFAAAAKLVELYENKKGALFTSRGQSSFAASWNGENNVNRALARAVFPIYQAIMDSTNSTLIASNPELVDGLMFKSTENFPGTVRNLTSSRATYNMRIDASLSREFGSEGGYSTNSARRMTGAYLVPGTIAEVIVPRALVNKGYFVRVGGHSWDLKNKPNVNRLYRVSRSFKITNTVTRIANPMGGNIYIEVPVGANNGIVDVQFRNTIRAPFFSARSFDKTSKNNWESFERKHPGVFTDIESEHSMWTIPTKWVTNLGYNALRNIITAHDENIQVASEYVGKNARRHKAILYMIADTQIRGRAFSIGYPQSNYGNFSSNEIRAPLSLGNALNKVLWHEHGHAELVTMFTGEQEAHVHTLIVAILMENYGYTPDQAFARSMAYGPDSGNFNTSDILNSWVLNQRFVNGNNMTSAEAGYQPRGHGDYVEYIEMFGLDAMKRFNRQINTEMNGRDWNTWTKGRTNHNNNDRILRLSRAAGVNVAPLFHLWGHAPNNISALNNAARAEGLLPSALIYDRLVAARNNVPLTQAKWNALKGKILAYVSPTQREAWKNWNNAYYPGRGERAVARIQDLIWLYFPNGRP